MGQLNNLLREMLFQEISLKVTHTGDVTANYVPQWEKFSFKGCPDLTHVPVLLIIIAILRFPQCGRQRERHNSFLCFRSKKLTAKIYHKRFIGQFTKEDKTKASIRIPEKSQVDLQTLQFGRGCSRNLKTVFPTFCNITRQLHVLLGH